MLCKWGKGGLFLVPIVEFWYVILYVKDILVGHFGNLNAFYNFIPVRKYLEFLESKCGGSSQQNSLYFPFT